MRCEGCGRNWSAPYPDVCPECGFQMVGPVEEPLPFEPEPEVLSDNGTLDADSRRHRHSYRNDGTCACGAVHPLREV